MGCTFDMYSSNWNYRSYCYVLLLLCYCFPLCIIFFSNFGIIYHTTRLSARDIPTPSSNIRYQPKTSIILDEKCNKNEEETIDAIDSHFQMQNGLGPHKTNKEDKTKVRDI